MTLRPLERTLVERRIRSGVPRLEAGLIRESLLSLLSRRARSRRLFAVRRLTRFRRLPPLPLLDLGFWLAQERRLGLDLLRGLVVRHLLIGLRTRRLVETPRLPPIRSRDRLDLVAHALCRTHRDGRLQEGHAQLRIHLGREGELAAETRELRVAAEEAERRGRDDLAAVAQNVVATRVDRDASGLVRARNCSRRSERPRIGCIGGVPRTVVVSKS